jgi:NAD+ synthetase
MQSRLRGVTLMALSNKFGALVLTTGNKSEMAVGYCTLYGDMNGALAPLADVLKTDIYKIARWVNREKIVIPGKFHFKTAERGIASEPDGPGFVAALRNAGCDP